MTERQENWTLYLATRDIRRYFDDKPDVPHTLVSVAGGLGFVHLISDLTQNIYLIDRKKNQLEYVELMINLIKASDDVFDFLSMVCGKKVNKTSLDSSCITEEKADWSDVINCEHIQLYKALQSDFNQNRLNLFDENNFDDPAAFKRNKDTYFWHFGESNTFSAFCNDESFQIVKNVLSSRKVEVINQLLEDVDYSTFQDPKVITYVYVSNADRRFYTKHDRIYKRIIETARNKSTIIYKSWHRTVSIRKGLHHKDAIEKLKPFTENRVILELKNYNGFSFEEEDLKAKRLEVADIFEDREASFKRVGDIAAILLYHLSLKNLHKNHEMVREYMYHSIMKFGRIIILDKAYYTHYWIDLLRDMDFHYSYQMEYIDWSGGLSGFDRNVIMVWKLRGHHKPDIES